MVSPNFCFPMCIDVHNAYQRLLLFTFIAQEYKLSDKGRKQKSFIRDIRKQAAKTNSQVKLRRKKDRVKVDVMLYEQYAAKHGPEEIGTDLVFEL